MRQLAQVFQWCEEHNIEMSLFDLPGHMTNYRVAASYLYHRVFDASSKQEAEQRIRDAVVAINSHTANKDTRAMVQASRQ